MKNWTEANLKSQYDRVAEVGWLHHFELAARAVGVDPALLLGIASRESNIMQIVSPDGNGYGIMQLDINAHHSFVSSDRWRDPLENILEGAHDLAMKRFSIASMAGKHQTLTDHLGNHATFTVPEVKGHDFLRCVVAAYNCGLWSVYHYWRGNDIDAGTANKDYSSDVILRASYFSRMHVNQFPVMADATPK